MLYDMKTRAMYTEILIKKGQKELLYDYKIEREDQVYGFVSWNTTASIEKTQSGFKLKFAMECPQENGKLFINIHSP